MQGKDPHKNETVDDGSSDGNDIHADIHNNCNTTTTMVFAFLLRMAMDEWEFYIYSFAASSNRFFRRLSAAPMFLDPSTREASHKARWSSLLRLSIVLVSF